MLLVSMIALVIGMVAAYRVLPARRRVLIGPRLRSYPGKIVILIALAILLHQLLESWPWRLF